MQILPEHLIIRSLAGECSEEEFEQLTIWLNEAEENRSTYLEYKAVWNSKNVRTYSEEKFLTASLNNFNDRISAIKAEKRGKVLSTYMRYAAVFIILIGLPLVFYINNTRKHETIEYTSTLVPENAPIKVIKLSDGTIVWLNKGTKITYPVSFASDERKVILNGEAYLEVTKDTKRPFIVESGELQIKVLGTGFNVKTATERNDYQATLVHGKIALENKKGLRLAILSPGEMASIDRLSKSLKVETVNTDLYTSWRQGLIKMNKATVNEIIQKLEEVYKVDIRQTAKRNAEKRYNFVFKQEIPLDSALEMLKFIAPLDYKRNSNEIIISDKK